MDVSSLKGGNTTANDTKPAVEYTAQVASPAISGEVKMTIGDNGLTVVSLFAALEITYAEINALELTDYVVTVKADSGDYSLSRLGNWCQPFYDTLYNKYNLAVLRSLFIKSSPVLTAKGDFIAAGSAAKRSIPICVFDNNVTALPPDLSARRVPLCFVNGINKGDYSLTLFLDNGENYTFSKLGYETVPFATAVEKRIRALREESLVAVKEIDPSIATLQASQIAGIMPLGVAAPIGRIAGMAPSFAFALEAKIAATRAAEYYKEFKMLCDASQIWIGFRKNEAAEESAAGGIPGSLAGDLNVMPGKHNAPASENTGEADAATPDPCLLWLIAPSPNGLFAAVEFAEPDSATFIYRTNGDFAAFAKQINRALEAIDFKREVIRLSDEELNKPENKDYFMAVKRTVALQMVRSSFVARVVHSSPESWKRKLQELWSGA